MGSDPAQWLLGWAPLAGSPGTLPCPPPEGPSALPPSLPCRLIELHSPDSRNTLVLRCKDAATAHSWFTAIHANVTALLPQVLAELNAMLAASSTPGGSKEVKHLAWLAEQVGAGLGAGGWGCPLGAEQSWEEALCWGLGGGAAALHRLGWQQGMRIVLLGGGSPKVPPGSAALALRPHPRLTAVSSASLLGGVWGGGRNGASAHLPRAGVVSVSSHACPCPPQRRRWPGEGAAGVSTRGQEAPPPAWILLEGRRGEEGLLPPGSHRSPLSALPPRPRLLLLLLGQAGRGPATVAACPCGRDGEGPAAVRLHALDQGRLGSPQPQPPPAGHQVRLAFGAAPAGGGGEPLLGPQAFPSLAGLEEAPEGPANGSGVRGGGLG